MTTQDDIVFFCIFCSQKIAIQDPKGGFTVECPACLRRIPVPRRQDLGSNPASRSSGDAGEPGKPQNSSVKRITIPKGASLNGSAPRSPSATVTIPPPPPESRPPPNDISLFVLGCFSLVLGVLLALVVPHAVVVHVSLFLTALVAALLCIARRLIGLGATLLFATIFVIQLVEVPLVTPLLRRLAPEPVVVYREDPTPAPDHEARRLVFDQNGETALATAQTEEEEIAPPEPVVAEPEVQEPEAPETTDAPEEVVAVEPVQEEAPASLPEIAEAPEKPARAAPAQEPVSFTSKPNLPLKVYSDCSVDPPYSPSGWMGYFDAIDLDECWEENPHSGKNCFRIAYNATYYWGAVAWQTPPNNWGNIAGGYDLSEAKELTFWARAERDATMAEFKVGINSPARFADTATISTGKKKLTTKWKQFRLPLKDVDLSRVISGFVCVVEGAEIPPIIYLDDIEYR